MLPDFISRAAVREVDRRAIDEFAVPGVVLMENAGRGVSQWLQPRVTHGPVRICCGRGNNGGDGFVVARHLDNAGVSVQVLLFASPEAYTGDAAVNLEIIRRCGLPLSVFGEPLQTEALERLLRSAEWIVDALLGTGAQGEVREPYAGAIRVINASPARVLAVDLPSGMDCDTGSVNGECVGADVTLTFVAPKLGFRNPDALKLTGDVHVVDIGVPRQLLESHEWDCY